jgi:hypothetical protein
MPVLPDVPEVLKYVLKFKFGDDVDVVNIFHLQYVGAAPSVSHLDTMANDLFGNWGSNVAPDYNNNLTLTETEIIDLTSPTASVGSATGSTSGAGTGTPEAADVAACISRQISRRYRGGHSRVYTCGMEEGHRVSPQEWDPAQILIWQDDQESLEAHAITDAVSVAGFSGCNPVSVSYYHGFTNFLEPSGRYRAIPTLRGTPLIDQVISYRGNPKIASQRRRTLQSS